MANTRIRYSGPLLLILAGFVSILASPGINAGSILPPPAKISTHSYAWIGPYGGPDKKNKGYRMNLGFIVGEKSVAVIDTGYTRDMAKEMIAHIKKITDRPIHYVINTNSQPHRHLGNDVFRATGATIITTPAEAKRMFALGGNFTSAVERNLGLAQGRVKIPAPPNRLNDKPVTLDLGGKVIVNLVPVGANHTPDSIIAVVKKDKTIYTGDLLYSGRLLAVLPDSSVKSWISAFDKLRDYKGYTFVPGHGQAAKLKAFEFPTYQYLTHLYKYMSAAIDEDVGLDDAMEKLDQSAFSKLANFEILAGPNASWTYLEVEKAAFE